MPDIAADANTNNLECFNSVCQGGWGGTSFASPIWAGMIALVNQANAAAGKPPVGFLNPTLYATPGTGKYHEELHDIIGGTSGLYTAVKGYDLVTGLGSPQGVALARLLDGAK